MHASFAISNQGLQSIKNIANFFQNRNHLHVTPITYQSWSCYRSTENYRLSPLNNHKKPTSKTWLKSLFWKKNRVS